MPARYGGSARDVSRRVMSAVPQLRNGRSAWGRTDSGLQYEIPKAPYGPGASGLFDGLLGGSGANNCGCRTGPAKEVESLEDTVRKLRLALTATREMHRVSLTERRRLEEELGRARTNLVKAEELLNVREKTLSPTIGLSQMYRTPETTSLVTALKQRVRALTAEKEHFRGELEKQLKTVKATQVSELQGELHATCMELHRQLAMTATMQQRMHDAEAAAAGAQHRAEEAMKLAESYTAMGSSLPDTPARLAPGNTISAGRVRKTVAALQQAHRLIASQAQLLRAMFPPGLSMEALSKRASLRAPTAGGPQVIAFLRLHISKVVAEMQGLPGGTMDPTLQAQTQRQQLAAPASADQAARAASAARRAAASADAAAAGPGTGGTGALSSSDPHVLMAGIADLVRTLRGMDMDAFMGQPELEADVEQLADVVGLFQAEVKRLTGVVDQPTFADDEEGDEDLSSQDNPLYAPVPKADPDLVPEPRKPSAPPSAAPSHKSAPPRSDVYDDDFAADDDPVYEDDFAAEGDTPSRPVSGNGSAGSRAPGTPQKHGEAPASSIAAGSETPVSISRPRSAASSVRSSLAPAPPNLGNQQRADDAHHDTRSQLSGYSGYSAATSKAGGAAGAAGAAAAGVVVGGAIGAGAALALADDDDRDSAAPPSAKAPEAEPEPEPAPVPTYSNEYDFGNVGNNFDDDDDGEDLGQYAAYGLGMAADDEPEPAPKAASVAAPESLVASESVAEPEAAASVASLAEVPAAEGTEEDGEAAQLEEEADEAAEQEEAEAAFGEPPAAAAADEDDDEVPPEEDEEPEAAEEEAADADDFGDDDDDLDGYAAAANVDEDDDQVAEEEPEADVQDEQPQEAAEEEEQDEEEAGGGAGGVGGGVGQCRRCR